MNQWIFENRQWLFHTFSTSKCLVHGTDCLTCPSEDVTCVLPLESDDLGDDAAKPVRPLRVNSAGNTCKGWSAVGAQGRFADPSERAHSIWSAERMSRAERRVEDIFFEECTVLYPVDEKLRQPLRETHHVISIQTGPEVMGFPAARPRSFAEGLAKWSMIWLGPETLEGIQQDFDKIFHTTMELTGDIFFLEEAGAAHDYMVALVQKRGIHSTVASKLEPWDRLRAAVPAGAGVRLDAYSKLREERQGVGGCFIADVQQWPGVRYGSGGPIWPCMLTHGCLVSWHHQRVATGMEHMAAQGLHVFDTSTGFRSPLCPVLEKMTCAHLKKLSGNG
eukprot:15711968-Heterocapsa_arctica.AAC.1